MPLDDRGMWVIEGWEAGRKARPEKHLHIESEESGQNRKGAGRGKALGGKPEIETLKWKAENCSLVSVAKDGL